MGLQVCPFLVPSELFFIFLIISKTLYRISSPVQTVQSFTYTPMAIRYPSSRVGKFNCSFESVVLQGLAADGVLFLPEEIPAIPSDWSETCYSWPFKERAFRLFSLCIPPSEIPSSDLRATVQKSCSSNVFRRPEVTPLVTLDEAIQLYLRELYCGPTFAFKVQFVGSLFEYILVRRNQVSLRPGRRI